MSDVGPSVCPSVRRSVRSSVGHTFFPTKFSTTTKEVATITKEITTITMKVATITKEVATITCPFGTGWVPLLNPNYIFINCICPNCIIPNCIFWSVPGLCIRMTRREKRMNDYFQVHVNITRGTSPWFQQQNICIKEREEKVLSSFSKSSSSSSLTIKT